MFLSRAIKTSPWFSLFTLGCILLFLALGFWQVERLRWKENLITAIQKKTAQPALSLEDFGDLRYVASDEDFTPVQVRAKFLHEHTIYLAAKYFRGQSGYHVITPAIPKGYNQAILINRGWVPDKKKDPATRPGTEPEGINLISGVFRLGEKKAWFMPDNTAKNQVWLWLDLPGMVDYLNTQQLPVKVLPILIQQTGEEQNSTQLPVPLPVHFTFRNDHLEYAITWFSLAIVTIVMYVLFMRKKLYKN